MESYMVVSRNADGQVLYPEGDYPTVESARQAARELRSQYPSDSQVVREGWFTSIDVVPTDGAAFGPRLYHC